MTHDSNLVKKREPVENSRSSVNQHFVSIVTVCCCIVSLSCQHQQNISFSAVLLLHEVEPPAWEPELTESESRARNHSDGLIDGVTLVFAGCSGQ